MAVEIKYVVIREGEEKMSFASKKEADAYDKMLDLAEVLNDWLVECPLTLMKPSAMKWHVAGGT
jgi:dsDNA-binding SOS-regulon protein